VSSSAHLADALATAAQSMCRVTGSTPHEGSSKNSTEPDDSSAMPTRSLRLLPPESSFTLEGTGAGKSQSNLMMINHMISSRSLRRPSPRPPLPLSPRPSNTQNAVLQL
jgi:hypothetical protein